MPLLQSSTTIETLRIHLFGQPRFFASGGPHKFVAPPRTLPLLAFLLLHREAHLTRDSIAFTLWPDDSEESARTHLRRHLNYLKNALPPGTTWFLAEGDTVGWNLSSGVWLDVASFEGLVAQDDRLEEAVELYAGDLLASLYDDWIIVMRERLRAQYLAALDMLLLRARSRRAFASAAGYARRILREDPWREDALRGLMSVRYESGDRTGALQEFDDFARRLEGEVGVEPMPETVAVRDLVLRGAALPDSASGSPETEPEGRDLPAFPFVGRRAQLETLQAAWTRAARGRGNVVLVGGEAGIGKSRLAAELALFAGAQGGRVLRGTTPAPERIPYQALAEALRAAAPLVAKLDVPAIWLAALGVLLPEVVTARTDVPVLPALDPDREQARLFEALATTLSALAKARPLLLVLDDLQWAGLSTVRALEFLARRAAAQSWLIVATYRSESVDPGDPFAALRRRLANENLIGSIVLGGLAPDEVRALVAALPPLAAQSDALGRRIAAISEGNPLFACELVRDFIERGDVAEASAKLETTIAARLGRLGERARTVAEIASVAGATFDIETVAQVAGWSEHELFEATGELLDRRIVREIGRSSFTFAFSHHLIASALYATIPAERLARWHLRLASIIERSAESGTSATLAHHLAAAGEPARAAAAYLAAGHDAFAVYANVEACEFATRGLALHETVDTLRFELLALRERIFDRLGDAGARAGELAELARVAPALGDGIRDDAVLQRRIEYEHACGERAAELHAIEELYRRASERDDERVLAAALEAEALYCRSTAQFEDACRLAGEALERYARLDDDAGRVRALTIGALCAAALGRAQGQTLIDHASRIADGTGDMLLRSRVLLGAATVAVFRQDFRRFAESAEKTLELCRSAGDREGEAVCHHQVGTAYWTAWRVRESHEHLRIAVHLCEELRARDGVTRSLCNLGSLMQDCGLYDESREIHKRALGLATELGAGDLTVVCELNLGLIHEAQGDVAAAMDCAQRALAGATRLGVKRYIAASLAQRGTLHRRLGAIREAVDDLERAVSLARETGRPADAAEWLGYSALAHLHGGQTERARGAIEEARGATEGATTGAFLMYPTQFYWAAAQVYRTAGEGTACAQALERAREELRTRTQALPDERWRQAYAKIAAHREIVAAAERDEWPALSRST